MQQNNYYSRQCIEFTHSLDFQNIPDDVIYKVKGFLLDYMGCVIQGYVRPQSIPVKTYVNTMTGATQATLFGEKRQTTITQSAFYHGYLGHILEMDDVDRESITHPATVVMPAALAVSELNNATGKDLITAIVAGYEVMLAIGSAITPAHYRIWHTTSTAGAFGSAMAAGKLLNLSQQQLTWALGNAGTMAAGLWQFLPDGAMSKFLHAGRAAENGVLAAWLASVNFTGETQILEGEQGFFAGFAHQPINPQIFADLGERFRTATVSLKPYPCCRHTHSSIDAANALRVQVDDVNQLSQIEVNTYSGALQVANITEPKTPQEAKFSLRFCVARTLLYGPVQESDFTAQSLHDPATRTLMDKIIITTSAKQDSKWPRFWPSEIIARYQEKTIAAQINSPKGDPDNPLNWSGIVDKFMLMSRGVLSPEGQRYLVDCCEHLEQLEHCDNFVSNINNYLI